MERLSAKKKVAVVRQYLSGLSYNEIGAESGVSKGTVANVVTDLLNGLTGEQCPFGTVLICVGTKGMPDDVQVVCISRLARESNREESEVSTELRIGGCLLFDEKAFSLLIDKLTCDVQEGRLLLTISTEKLTEIETSSCLKLEVKKSA